MTNKERTNKERTNKERTNKEQTNKQRNGETKNQTINEQAETNNAPDQVRPGKDGMVRASRRCASHFLKGKDKVRNIKFENNFKSLATEGSRYSKLH
jgi:hypothetical protein